MKNFFKKITHDPYTDWFLIVVFLTIVAVVFATFSYFKYREGVSTMKDVSISATTTGLKINNKEIADLVQLFENKIKDSKAERVPVIDVRDPSL